MTTDRSSYTSVYEKRNPKRATGQISAFITSACVEDHIPSMESKKIPVEILESTMP